MRHRRTILAIVALAAGLVLAACAQAPYREGAASGSAASTPLQQDDRPLRERIVEERYTEWKVAPGYQVPQPANGPHGEKIQIFLNDEAATAREQALERWPDQSLIVADMTEDHTIVRTAVMEKRNGDWYFAQWTADGKPSSAEELGRCTGCHSRGTDGTLAVRIGP